jgi:hypothetical protein
MVQVEVLYGVVQVEAAAPTSLKERIKVKRRKTALYHPKMIIKSLI